MIWGGVHFKLKVDTYEDLKVQYQNFCCHNCFEASFYDISVNINSLSASRYNHNGHRKKSHRSLNPKFVENFQKIFIFLQEFDV